MLQVTQEAIAAYDMSRLTDLVTSVIMWQMIWQRAVLHAGMCRQLGCDEQQDILRPYSTINYAWDEPSLPHKLVLSLPGNRVLGVFEPDKVHTLCT